jgi:hypothetical protein
MEAPKGVEINAEAGNMEATCRTELRLESKDGEVRSGKDRHPKRPGSKKPTFPKAGLPMRLVLQCIDQRSQSEAFIFWNKCLNSMNTSQTHNT